LLDVVPPVGTAGNSSLALEVLDPVTGLDYNSYRVPLERLDNGHFQAHLTPQLGSLLAYRYVRVSPSQAVEVDAYFEPVHLRTVYVPGPAQLQDVIAGWSDQPYSGPTGRVLGQLANAASGAPLVEQIVSIGGRITFSDAAGKFRVDGLPPGMHHLTVFSPDGAFQPAQQGAQVAAGATTPVELALQPASPLHVTFELTVPADTPAEAVVRIAGNVLQLGNRFVDLSGGIRTSNTHMPEMVRVDPTHFLAILPLYEGTDLRYKYTLGDGFWNAERGQDGQFVIRQLVLSSPEPILRDEVQSWSSDGNPALHFEVGVPQQTPQGEGVALQLKPGQWFTPLSMWPQGDLRFAYDLYSPLNFNGEVAYRYCRSLACGSADDIDTVGPDPAGRPMPQPAAGAAVTDQVDGWQWYQGELNPGQVVAVPSAPRPGYEGGIELLPNYRLDWERTLPAALDDIAASGANAVTYSPRWQVSQLNPFPRFEFNPALTPFAAELGRWIELAHARGLQVALRPGLSLDGSEVDAFWQTAARDSEWWKLWFEGYSSLLLSYARLAATNGVEELVLDLHTVSPALPGGLLSDGSPSGVPGDAETIWRSLLADIQDAYPGRLTAELEYGAELQHGPLFLDSFDRLRLYWHAALAEDPQAGIDQLQEMSRILLEAALAERSLGQLPVVLSVEYLSLQGSALACPPAPDGSCLPASDFNQGAIVDPDLAVDLDAQARAINALLLAAQAEPGLAGISVRGYDPGPVMHDKSASIRGKPAQDVVAYWYEHLLE